MKGRPFLVFVLGVALGSVATYFVMREEVRRAVAEATEQVGKTVKDVGMDLEKAGRKMRDPQGSKPKR